MYWRSLSAGVSSSKLFFALSAGGSRQADTFRSCAKLAYSDAQDVISGSKLSAKVEDEQQATGLEEDIRNLGVGATRS
jgi:hypothetical protein